MGVEAESATFEMGTRDGREARMRIRKPSLEQQSSSALLVGRVRSPDLPKALSAQRTVQCPMFTVRRQACRPTHRYRRCLAYFSSSPLLPDVGSEWLPNLAPPPPRLASRPVVGLNPSLPPSFYPASSGPSSGRNLSCPSSLQFGATSRVGILKSASCCG